MNRFEEMKVIEELKHVHQELDTKTQSFKQETRMSCLEGCGKCCISKNVESFPGEWVELALDVASGKNTSFGTLDELLAKAQKEVANPCIMFRPDPTHHDKGSCGAYDYRPIVCRLFGFSTVRMKNNARTLVTCRQIKALHTDIVQRDLNLLPEKVPSNEEYRGKIENIVTMHPTLGTLLPINKAIAIALEFVALKLYYLQQT